MAICHIGNQTIMVLSISRFLTLTYMRRSQTCVKKAIEDVFTSDKQGRAYDATILHGRSVTSDMIEQHNVILFTTQKPEAVVVIVPDDNTEDVILFFVASRELSLTITLQCH